MKVEVKEMKKQHNVKEQDMLWSRVIGKGMRKA
jgi:hypothetical protein